MAAKAFSDVENTGQTVDGPLERKKLDTLA
jgi:hypothetical protein